MVNSDFKAQSFVRAFVVFIADGFSIGICIGLAVVVVQIIDEKVIKKSWPIFGFSTRFLVSSKPVALNSDYTEKNA